MRSAGLRHRCDTCPRDAHVWTVERGVDRAACLACEDLYRPLAEHGAAAPTEQHQQQENDRG